MDSNSMEAVEARNIEILYESIGSDPYILNKADEIPFANSTLHVAASTGQTLLAIEIMNLKPSLATKLNPDGLSPLHLALLNGHSETAKGLIKLNKDLVRIKGRERLTPLHYAVELDDCIDILAEFLCACPESIGDLNVRGETALHFAVKKSNARALGVLMGWIRKTGKHWAKNIKDGRGNTILHTAVSTSQPHIVEPVVQGYGLHINEKNFEGATALDIAEALAPGSARTKIMRILSAAGASKSSSLANDCSLVDFLVSRESRVETIFRTFLSMRKGMSMEMRNAVIVVAALITTATFQAVLTLPGGGGGGGASDDTPNVFLPVFYAMNTIAFISSITMINILILPLKIFAALHASLMFMTMGYGIAFLIVPSMYQFEFILAFSAIAIASLLYGAHYIPIMIEDLYKIDKGLLFMSHLQRKRLRMLYRVVMN